MYIRGYIYTANISKCQLVNTVSEYLCAYTLLPLDLCQMCVCLTPSGGCLCVFSKCVCVCLREMCLRVCVYALFSCLSHNVCMYSCFTLPDVHLCVYFTIYSYFCHYAHLTHIKFFKILFKICFQKINDTNTHSSHTICTHAFTRI